MNDQVTYPVLSVNDIPLPVVAAHDADVSVLPGQLERVGDLVEVGVEEGQDGTESASPVSTLIVVVVDEDESTGWTQLTPTLTEVLEVRQSLSVVLAHDIAEVLTVTEFSDSSDVRVLVVAYCFAAQVNHLRMECL